MSIHCNFSCSLHMCCKKFFEKIFKILCIFADCCTFLMGTSFEPPNKEGEKNVLSKEEIWMRKFDACVKKALIQELKYRKRSMKTQRERIVNFSEIRNDDERQLYLEDTYEIERFSQTIETNLFHAVIHDELLYEALQILTPSNREILLLKYWGEMTDAEIGRVLSMSQQRVNYNRSKSLKLLKRRIEEMIRDDKRFKF